MAAQPRFVRCPSCQWGTLADGNFCAYCGQPLRQGAQAPRQQAQAQAPAQAAQQQQYQQPYPQQYQQPQAGSGSTQYYYQPPGQTSQYYQPGSGSGAAFAAPSARGPIPCPNCGAPNDPWLTHCKQCTRPLMSSG
jgi:predicted amidophosphoribosyltransferase